MSHWVSPQWNQWCLFAPLALWPSVSYDLGPSDPAQFSGVLLSSSSPRRHLGRQPDDGRNWAEWRCPTAQPPGWLEMTLEPSSLDFSPRCFLDAPSACGGGSMKAAPRFLLSACCVPSSFLGVTDGAREHSTRNHSSCRALPRHGEVRGKLAGDC